MASVTAAPPVGKLETGRFTITIPDNGLTRVGIDLIQDRLLEWTEARIPDHWRSKGKYHSWEWAWKVPGKGEYVGALPKRVAKYIYQECGKKLTPDQMSRIGNLATRHSVCNATYYCDITDDFDWTDGDFGDGGSCFWSCHSYARETMLPDHSAFAIRFWKTEDWEEGFARAWIIPYQDCYIVFNGYGMETLPIARVLSAYLGHAYYRRVEFTNNGDSGGSLYINGGFAWLVGPQDSVVEIDAINLDWEEGESGYSCEYCNCSIDEDEHQHDPDGDDCCEECYRERVSYCECCNEDFWSRDSQADPDGDDICESCFSANCTTCQGCDEPVWDRDIKDGLDGKSYCESCFDQEHSECCECGETCLDSDLEDTLDGMACASCAETINEWAQDHAEELAANATSTGETVEVRV
jgi:hypothetical protein